MKALLVARKTLVELVREPLTAVFLALLPLGFLGITALSYSAPLEATHNVLCHAAGPRAEALAAALRARRYADGRAVFRVSAASAGGEKALRERTADLVVDLRGERTGECAVVLTSDAMSPAGTRASLEAERTLRAAAERLDGLAAPPTLVERALGSRRPSTGFEAAAPGMVVFALLMLVPAVAAVAGREKRTGGLDRLRLAGVGAPAYFAGIALAFLAVGAVQIVLMLAASKALGFAPGGSPLLVGLLGLAVALSAVGSGLLTACFVADDAQAVNLGSIVAMVQVFLSGAFFPMPTTVLATVAGHELGLYDLLPATHCVIALRQTLCYGAGFAEVAFRLTASVVLGAACLALGSGVFHHRCARGSV